jgi:hypothetical protein
MLPAALLLALLPAAAAGAASVVQHSNVLPQRDSHGSVLDAHETQIVRWDPAGPWYMYAMKYALCHPGPTHKSGCSKNRTKCDFRSDHNMSVFTSPDLAPGSWTWYADILPVGASGGASCFRGKVLHNKISSTYVLWIFCGANLVMATSPSPTGPFTLHSSRKSNDVLLHSTGDLSFLIDEKAGDDRAYIIYNANMKGIVIEQLAPDYLGSLGRTNPAAYSSAVFGEVRFPQAYLSSGKLVCFPSPTQLQMKNSLSLVMRLFTISCVRAGEDGSSSALSAGRCLLCAVRPDLLRL